MKRGPLLLLLLVLTIGGALCVLAADSDGDGLSDAEEAVLSTDALNPDSDGDGLSDGEEYLERFTDPLREDTDGDGLLDAEDAFPQRLAYRDLYDVTTVDASLHETPDGEKLVQQVVVKVCDVITIDWNAYLTDFVLVGAEFGMSRDFCDPAKTDWAALGHYALDEELATAEIVLPTSHGLFEANIPWLTPSMTPSDWPYHVYAKELQVGQTHSFHVFSHELLAWGEDPFFVTRGEVLGIETLPMDLRVGRREYEVYVVECTWDHVTFSDPYFSIFLGEAPRLTVRAYFTVDHHVLLRYTTPYFRVTPSKSVGFSDFFVDH